MQRTKKKLVLTGPENSGKSAILGAIHGKKVLMYKKTIGIDFAAHKTETADAHVWDTSGDKRFNHIIKTYYCGASAVWFVFDSSDENSIREIPYFIELFLETVPDQSSVKKYLVGNKCDKQITWLTKSRVEQEKEKVMDRFPFLSSFSLSSFDYGEVKRRIESTLGLSVPSFPNKTVENKTDKRVCSVS